MGPASSSSAAQRIVAGALRRWLMNGARTGGYALLMSAGAGAVASVIAPRRWGRAGSACVAGGLSVWQPAILR